MCSSDSKEIPLSLFLSNLFLGTQLDNFLYVIVFGRLIDFAVATFDASMLESIVTATHLFYAWLHKTTTGAGSIARIIIYMQ